MIRGMSPRTILGIMALTACTSTGTLPSDVAESLAERSTAGAAYLEIEGQEVIAWGIPIRLRDLPDRVQRAAASIQPDGTLVSAHELWRGKERTFRVERSYGDTDVQWRSVELTRNTEVVTRSHSIALEDAPEAVRSALGTKTPQRFEFVQGRAGDRYRASYGDDNALSHAVELLANGTVHRQVRFHRAVMSVSP